MRKRMSWFVTIGDDSPPIENKNLYLAPCCVRVVIPSIFPQTIFVDYETDAKHGSTEEYNAGRAALSEKLTGQKFNIWYWNYCGEVKNESEVEMVEAAK